MKKRVTKVAERPKTLTFMSRLLRFNRCVMVM